MNTPWKILIPVLILSVALMIGSFVLLNKPTDSTAVNPTLDNTNENNTGEENTGETTGMQILEALPIFYSNSTVNSIEEASAILKQNLDAIEESATEKLLQYGKPNEANIIGDMVFFAEHVTLEKRAWRNDQYWLLPPRTAYVLLVPAVSKLENWAENENKILVERVNLTEGTVQSVTLPANTASFEDVKQYLNENYPGKTETFWTETKLWIKYLIDDNGTVYWAGQHLTSKPWLA